jgi:nucleoside-diphosphate-sugar epimerase
MEIRGKTILVTGGAGAIGTNLVRRLLEDAPDRVVVIDNQSSGLLAHLPVDGRVIPIAGDIRDEETLHSAFETYQPQVVFHLAAQFANQKSVDHPVLDFETNVGGTLKLLKRAAQSNVERVIYVSSSCVYQPTDKPMDDDLPPVATDTPYAISKGVGEQYAGFYAHRGLPITIVRLFNSFGPGEFPGRYRNVIPNFIGLAMQGKPLPITGTGDERRTFTFVGDVVDIMCRLAKNDEAVGQTVNLSSTNDVAIKELADMINRLTGNGAGVQLKPRRDWDAVTVRRPKLDKLTKLAGDFGRTTLEDGLRQTIAWANEHHNEFIRPIV